MYNPGIMESFRVRITGIYCHQIFLIPIWFLLAIPLLRDQLVSLYVNPIYVHIYMHPSWHVGCIIVAKSNGETKCNRVRMDGPAKCQMGDWCGITVTPKKKKKFINRQGPLSICFYHFFFSQTYPQKFFSNGTKLDWVDIHVARGGIKIKGSVRKIRTNIHTQKNKKITFRIMQNVMHTLLHQPTTKNKLIKK